MAKKNKNDVIAEPVYKPSMYFGSDSIIPKHIEKAQVGQKVKFVVEGTVISKSERDDAFTKGKRKSAEVQVDKVRPTAKKAPKKSTKPTTTKGTGKKK